MDLTNADTVDNLTRRNRELQAEVEQLKANIELATAEIRAHESSSWEREHVLEGVVAQNAGLRVALGAVEWTGAFQPLAEQQCHWCGNFEYGGHRDDCSRQAALADPSPLAEALGAVVGASITMRVAHDEYIALLETASDLPNEHIDAVSEEMDRADSEWTKAVDAYRALRDSMPLGDRSADGAGLLTVPADASDDAKGDV